MSAARASVNGRASVGSGAKGKATPKMRPLQQFFGSKPSSCVSERSAAPLSARAGGDSPAAPSSSTADSPAAQPAPAPGATKTCDAGSGDTALCDARDALVPAAESGQAGPASAGSHAAAAAAPAVSEAGAASESETAASASEGATAAAASASEGATAALSDDASDGSAEKLKCFGDKLAAILSECASRGAADEPDWRLGVDEAAQGALEEAACADTGFPDSWAPWLARLIQGSKLPMSELVREVSEALRESPPAARPIPSVEVVTDKVKLLAERKAYGVAPKGVVALEDTTGAALWHWEVLSAELLPEDHRGKIKSARADRTKTGKHVKSLIKLREVLTKDPTNAVKISQEEEKVLKFEREIEAARQKRLVQERKAEERRAKTDEREERDKQKAQAQTKKQRQLEEKEREETMRQEKAKTQRNKFVSFFKSSPTKACAADAAESAAVAASPASMIAAEPAGPMSRRDSCSYAKFDLREFEAALTAPAQSAAPAPWRGAKRRPERDTRRPKRIKLTVSVSGGGGNTFGARPDFGEQREIELGNKNKLFQFDEDHRPPYYGTWSKRSKLVTGRRPLARDTALLNYDEDSEGEWEEEEPGGESLSDSEQEDDAGDDRLDYNDGWLRQDDDIGASDQEDGVATVHYSAAPKKQVTRIIGPFFLEVGQACAPALEPLAEFAVSFLGNKPVQVWSSICDEPQEEEEPEVVKPKAGFDEAQLGALVRLLHKSANSKDRIVEAFLSDSPEPRPSKWQVSRKIKEIASYVSPHWVVTDEVLHATGWTGEDTTPEPAPRPAPKPKGILHFFKPKSA